MAKLSDLLTRRTVLTGLIGGCLTCRFANAQSRGNLPKYCSIDPSIELEKYRARSSTGDRRIDRALIAELRNVMNIIPVSPGFRIIDDVDGPNAFAMNRTVVPGTTGTVLFGIQLMRDEFVARNGGYAIAGIAAHECAHIYQFFSEMGSLLANHGATAKSMELHADFIAGFYMKHKIGSDRNLSVFARSLFSKGDFDFNSPNHHGIPAQRVQAMEAGYALPKGTGFERVAQLGADHVM